MIPRLTRAHEAGDVDGVVALLTDDVWVTTPPEPRQYQGRDLAARFLAAVSFRDGRHGRGTIRLRADDVVPDDDLRQLVSAALGRPTS